MSGAALFGLLTWQVAAGGALVARDGSVLRAVRRTAAAHPAFDGAAHALCDLGDIQVAVPLVLAAVCAAAWLRRRRALPLWWLPPAAGALAMALVPLVVSPVKSAVHRPPPGLTVPDPSGYGYFPSGHTATSSVAFGVAALLLLPAMGRGRTRRALAWGTAAVVSAVGVALVWCGYHWPADVLGSWCLALTLLPWVAVAYAADGGGRTGGGSRTAAAVRASGGRQGAGKDPGDSPPDDPGGVNCASGSPG